MKRWLKTAMAFGWGVFGHACAHSAGASGNAESTAASEYYPLGIGQEWTYQTQLLSESRKMKVRIVREESGYFIDNQGGRLRHDSAGVRDPQRYLLQNPVEVGHSWTNVLSPSVAEHYKIQSVGAGCESPAGQFSNCVVVESTTRLKEREGVLLNRMTFALRVGLVRAEVFRIFEGRRTLQSRLVLESYMAPSSRSRPAWPPYGAEAWVGLLSHRVASPERPE